MLTVRKARAGEGARAAAAVERGGWGDRSQFFAFAERSPACTVFVAEDDDAIIATGIGTANGTVGWVGMIWTAPDHRQRGLGRAMTERVMEDLSGRGCSTLMLDASELGRPIYERLGFEAVCREIKLGRAREASFAPTTHPVDATAVAIRQLVAGDLRAAAALDAEATGEDRHLLLEAWTAGSLAADGADGRLAGFALVPRFGGLAVLARDHGTGMALVRAATADAAPDEQLLAVPEANATALADLAAHGFVAKAGPLRMVLGPLPAWRPELIWGVMSFATG